MREVTADECKQVVKDRKLVGYACRECSICGTTIGWQFQHRDDIHPSWDDVLGVSSPSDTLAFFDANCDCTRYYSAPEPYSWHNMADHFNRQTPEVRAELWKGFAGKKVEGSPS